MKKLEFESILKNVIPNLPEYEPGKEVWESISSNLDFDAELNKTLPHLPDYQPDQNSWEKIEHRLNKKRRSTKVVQILRIPVGVAASILLFVAVYSILNSNHSTTLHYSEELVEEWTNNEADRPVKDNPEILIEEACQKATYICESEEFTEKKMLLDKVNQELQNVNREINRYGSSLSLEKAKIKLENLKAEALKDLIKQIQS
ncbi:MAG TPA: hypothetical protein DIW31_02125 [Bacteroidales bacterium]|nr:hypothetical protein [Bacteroidales bacterium]